MNICICNRSELECLRAMSAPGGAGISQSGESQLVAPAAKSFGEACRAHLAELGHTSNHLHVVVPTARDRIHTSKLTCHVMTEPVERENYLDFGAEIVGLSIEHFYVDMCHSLSFEQQMLLAYELCGWYTIVPNPNYEDEIAQGKQSYKTHAVERPPLTTVEKLRQFAQDNRHIRGSKLALRALKYVANCARSPEEARLAIVMLLPHNLGGYNRGPLLMDYRIDGAANYRKCDAFLLRGRVAVEYNSSKYHVTPADVERDSERTNELAALGIPVVNISREELRDPALFHKAMQHLALVQKLPLRIRTKDFPQKRAALWKALFS